LASLRWPLGVVPPEEKVNESFSEVGDKVIADNDNENYIVNDPTLLLKSTLKLIQIVSN
jgi:hypothetical protein